MSEPHNYDDIMTLMLRVINKFHELDKHPRDFGTGEQLYLPEIHAIAEIGRTPDLNITELADRLGVTKGTISPLVARLAKRKYVIKSKGGANRRDVLLRLTPRGQMAYHGHEMFHLTMHARLFQQVENNPEFLRLLHELLQVGEGLLDRYLKSGALE